MKLKLKKIETGEWQSGVYRGNGGVSSLIASRVSRSLWKALGVFSIKNIYRALTWENFKDKYGNHEKPQDNNGDFVSLVWMIEKIRRREGGCTMNELIEEAKRNFTGIEQIKRHR